MMLMYEKIRSCTHVRGSIFLFVYSLDASTTH
jgi:hypothetical protein